MYEYENPTLFVCFCVPKEKSRENDDVLHYTNGIVASQNQRCDIMLSPLRLKKKT